MKKSLFTICIFSILLSCSNNPKKVKTTVTYPITEKKEVVDNYFDTVVKDPYRWLEDDRSKETESWVKAFTQDSVSLDLSSSNHLYGSFTTVSK